MINDVTLIGNLGNEPEVKQYGDNILVRFRLATSESWKDKNGEWKEETQWHTCEMWRKYPIKNLVKGSKVYCKGKIKYREYEGKWYTSIELKSIRNLTPSTNQPPKDDNVGSWGDEGRKDTQTDHPEDDDLPF